MIIFTAIYRILMFLMLSVKRFTASFLLKNVMGWRINRDYDSYGPLRKGRHVVVYAHTSFYEPLIEYLVSVIYDIPLIAVAKRELRDIPLFGKFLSCLNLIFIDRHKNTNTTKYISEELDKTKDFVFSISPEGTRSLVSDLKSGFFFIAEKTHANLCIARFDFENHMFSIEDIVNDVVIQTTKYEKIKDMVEIEMRKEKPYHPEKCHLVSGSTIKKTSLICAERSILIYFPPFIVIMIMINILRGYVKF